jgi:hypothetical protein
MICNPVEGMCIAGVFGGIKSGVTSAQQKISSSKVHILILLLSGKHQKDMD